MMVTADRGGYNNEACVSTILQNILNSCLNSHFLDIHCNIKNFPAHLLLLKHMQSI
jgi:hypothetical protein